MSSEITFKSDMDVELVDYMGDDVRIVEAARVSTTGWNSAVADSTEKTKGLINFLMRDRHGTPFEHNSLSFRISAPMFVFYEFHRHRVGWSYNEESARYRELDPVFYVPGPDRALRQIGKPGAYTFELGNDEQYGIALQNHKQIAEDAWYAYKGMLSHGVAREVARNVLPVSIYKTMYATTNLRALMNFLSLRMIHEQNSVPTFPLDEIAQVATKLDAHARQVFPLAMEAFDKHGRVAP